MSARFTSLITQSESRSILTRHGSSETWHLEDRVFEVVTKGDPRQLHIASLLEFGERVLLSISMPRPKCPPVAADVIVEIRDHIVLIERRNSPFGWAIPGGFVDIGETVEETAVREVREEISLEVKLRALLGIYSRPERDPRGQTVSAVYVGRAGGVPKAADDAKSVDLFLPDQPPSPLAFDHADILRDYLHFLDTGKLPSPWRRR